LYAPPSLASTKRFVYHLLGGHATSRPEYQVENFAVRYRCVQPIDQLVASISTSLAVVHALYKRYEFFVGHKKS
jgi:hypothetical protein